MEEKPVRKTCLKPVKTGGGIKRKVHCIYIYIEEATGITKVAQLTYIFTQQETYVIELSSASSLIKPPICV